jgi:hypothetical protein
MRVFMSYRRGSTTDISGRIYDRLCDHFGPDAVFRDLDSISLGASFLEQLQRALSETDVLLAIIGKDWLERGDLSSEQDFVRLELQEAFRRRIRVIPVLVGGADLPAASGLPECLRQLPLMQALTVDSGVDFGVHTDRLIRGILPPSNS